MLVSSSEDRTIKLWDLATFAARERPSKAQADWPLAVALSPDRTPPAGRADTTARSTRSTSRAARSSASLRTAPDAKPKAAKLVGNPTLNPPSPRGRHARREGSRDPLGQRRRRRHRVVFRDGAIDREDHPAREARRLRPWTWRSRSRPIAGSGAHRRVGPHAPGDDARRSPSPSRPIPESPEREPNDRARNRFALHAARDPRPARSTGPAMSTISGSRREGGPDPRLRDDREVIGSPAQRAGSRSWVRTASVLASTRGRSAGIADPSPRLQVRPRTVP